MEVDIRNINYRLDRILSRLSAVHAKNEDGRKKRETLRLVKYGLRVPEAEAWLENEPDLASDDSYHGQNPIRSYQNLSPPCLYQSTHVTKKL